MAKKNIKVTLDTVEFCGGLRNSIAQLQRYQDTYGADYTRLYLDGDMVSEAYSDDGHYVLHLMGERLENDAEYEKRLAGEAALGAKQEERDRVQYEILKNKFEGVKVND